MLHSTLNRTAVLALNGRRLNVLVTVLLFHPARRVLIRVLPLAAHTQTHGWHERWHLQNLAGSLAHESEATATRKQLKRVPSPAPHAKEGALFVGGVCGGWLFGVA